MSKENQLPHRKPIMSFAPHVSEATLLENGLELLEKAEQSGPLALAIRQATGTVQKKKHVPRLAFAEDPQNSTMYGGVFKNKVNLLPDYIKKQIRTNSSLVASILRARSNQLALNGHIRRDRFDVGIEVMLKPEFAGIIKSEQMTKIKDRIAKIEKTLMHCGSNEGLERDEKMSLSRFLGIQASNGLTFGWFGTEIIWNRGPNGEKTFNRFRPVDSGTIFYPTRKDEQEHEAIRRSALSALKQLKHIKLNMDLEALENDKYTYIQVITGIPRQAFTDDELLMTKIYDTTDIEFNNYPVGPMESALTAITTHISIGTYNKLFFQNGRAAKGMLVVKSQELDQAALDAMKAEFFSSINGVNNAFRVPLFGIDPQDDVNWVPMTSATGEGEYQFLYDQVARDILASFNMSPDELPGFGHLSRGTNQQTLSESNNLFQLTAQRDTGIRPLLMQFQSFFNEDLFPILDPELSKICVVRFAGIDAQTREQEALRLAQEAPLHYDYDSILTEVEKDPIGAHLAGKMPFNQQWNLAADKYINTANIIAELGDDSTALLNPLLNYRRDGFYLQHLQLATQINPTLVKAKYAYRPYQKDLLKLFMEDYIDGDEE